VFVLIGLTGKFDSIRRYSLFIIPKFTSVSRSYFVQISNGKWC